MTRYFFNVRNNARYLQDDEGIDLPHFNSAVLEAKTAVREMLSEMVLKGEPLNGEVFEITNVNGTIIVTVPWIDELRLNTD